MSIDDRVRAQVQVHLALASKKLADLEALEQQMPAMSGTSNRRLHLARQLTSTRKLVWSWASVTALLDAQDWGIPAEESATPEHRAPERIVAWVRYLENARDQVVCNRAWCKNAYPGVTGAEGTALRALDLPEGGICAQCGTDVLA